jgi:hypothetical protein
MIWFCITIILRYFGGILSMFFSTLLLSLIPFAQAVPLQITQQGRIIDANGQTLEGSQFVVFRIYDQETGGNIVWDEISTVQFTNGYYATILGTDELANPLDTTVLSSYPLFLELQLNNAAPMIPRQSINSSPYSQIAGVAESVDGGKVNASDIDIGNVPVIDGNRNWVGEPITVDWSQVQNIPNELTDGDDNTQLSEQEVENYITNDGVSLHQDTTLNGQEILTLGMDSDTLADLSCSNGDIPKYDSSLSSWYCDLDVDMDTLAGLSCTTDQISKWDGSAWGCQSDSDSLADLSCTTDQIAKWDGSSWVCSDQSGGIEYMTSSQRDALSSIGQQQMIFNTDTNCFQVYDSGTWLDNCFACNIPAQPSNINGNASVCLNASGEIFSIPSVANATSYTWTVPNGSSIISGQGTESITVDLGENEGSVCVTADVSCGSSDSQCFDIAFPSGSENVSFGSSAQQFIVPDCVTSIHAELYGASGGGAGGMGGFAEADIPVNPGDTLYIYTGEAGGSCTFCEGTFNGGGGRKHSGYTGYQGGGATDIRTVNGAWDDSSGLDTRLLVAAGGAGGGYNDSIGGGDGGGLEGQTGDKGEGGTQSSGGGIGTGTWCTENGNYVSAGGFGYGGTGQGANAGGGGGGGGWYGGGGGCFGGGGGGSSYSDTGNSNFNTISGTNSGSGYATITW